jgi:hypothetical protein
LPLFKAAFPHAIQFLQRIFRKTKLPGRDQKVVKMVG